MTARRLIGVLGGMGPMATVDFMRNVIEMTPADIDQQHVPMIVHCVPQVPDRVAAILEGRDDPLPVLIAAAAKLTEAGAELIVMPCHTAHAWFGPLAAATKAPMLHIATAALADLEAVMPRPRRVALLGTLGTLRAGIYQQRMRERNFEMVLPGEDVQADVLAAIAAVKRNAMHAAEAHADRAFATLAADGCEAALLACTELPLAARRTGLPLAIVDPTKSLARACIDFSLSA